ncbi:hypothetical protein BC829DRAFT_385878 [Chytridium lagenaria]|nr:hypothetical protein BC829DRAFT_385878 [Chytridium lagenaria]
MNSLFLLTALLFTVTSSKAASRSSSRPPHVNIILPPPPPPPSSDTSSKFRLAQIFHHGVIPSDTSKPECGGEFAGKTKLPHGRGVAGTSTGGNGRVGHRRGVPEWSAVSKMQRQKAWDERLRNQEESMGGFVDQTEKGRGGGFDALVEEVPNMTDTLTVLNLAKMTFNSYTEPTNKDWMGFRLGMWYSDGIRGYVFVDESKDTVVIAVKGTSLQTPVGDKFNDNMMFSCCCAKAGWSWTPICDCAKTTGECSMDCLYEKSQFSDSYYNLANTIYVAVDAWYPQSTNIWMVGHSLGGPSPPFWLSLTICLADGDPEHPPNYDGFLSTLEIYHVGNTRDPIYLGPLESRCHSGKECVYDQEEHDRNPQPSPPSRLLEQRVSERDSSVQERMDVRYHSIETVIHTYLETWENVPKCEVKANCSECSQWTYAGK